MKTNKSFPLFGLIAVLVVTWIFRDPILASLSWISDREAVASTIQRLGMWGPIAVSILLVLQVFLAFIPGQALMVTCGFLYGFWGGLFITWLSLVVGGQTAFLLARHDGRSFAERWVSQATLARWDRAAQGQGIGFFALSLVLPIFPNDAMCYVAGLGKISIQRFLVANMLGRGAACLLASLVGAYGSQIPVWGWALGISILLAGCVGWWLKKHSESLAPEGLKGDSHVCV